MPFELERPVPGGYLSKMSVPEEIIKAINMVLMGKRCITSGEAEHITCILQQSDSQLPPETLSARKFEIFILLAFGKTVSAIAEQLAIST